MCGGRTRKRPSTFCDRWHSCCPRAVAEGSGPACEVSDTGHTAPNLRYAASDDEGGRGLFIIAQMTHHWGTRYTPNGKAIWTEQEPADGP